MPFPHAASRTGTPFHCIDFAGMNPSKIDAGRPGAAFRPMGGIFYQFFISFVRTSMPPMYLRRTSGTTTEPSFS